MGTAKQRIAGFDGIRGIAALMVFVSHRVDGIEDYFFGGFGVRIFFVLSGFLIVGILHRDRVEIADGRLSFAAALKAFAVRRIARVFPLYYVFLGGLFGASLFTALPQMSGLRPLIYGLFLTDFYVEYTNRWLEPVTHIWSLAVEEQFYLLAAPLILILPSRYSRPACLMGAALSFAFVVWLSVYGDVFRASVGPLPNFGMFAMGGAAALRPTKSSFALTVRLQPILLVALILLPFIGQPFVANPVTRHLAYPLIAALLFAEMRDHQDTWLVKILEWRALSSIGVVSYGFYMLHPLIGAGFIDFVTWGAIDISSLDGWARCAVLLVASLLVASASWKFLEEPVLARAHRGRSRRCSAPPDRASLRIDCRPSTPQGMIQPALPIVRR